MVNYFNFQMKISFICISFAVETAQPDDDDWEPEKFGENFSKTFIGD